MLQPVITGQPPSQPPGRTVEPIRYPPTLGSCGPPGEAGFMSAINSLSLSHV